MADLATVVDLEDRLGRSLDGSETSRAEALLAGVSARVRTYTGQQFEQSETTDRLRVKSGRIRLPQRPVTDVADVDDMNGNSVAHVWHHGDVIEVSGLSSGVPFDVEPVSPSRRFFDVTYTHGYADIPADVVEVVCQMVLRAFGTDPSAAGITQESVEGYSYSFGAAGAAGAVGMLNDERAALDIYRRRGGTIRVAP